VELGKAQQLIARACEEAEKLGLAMGVAVVDAAGHVVSIVRMDGASFITTDVATAKAYTAAAVGIPTQTLNEVMKGHPEFHSAIAVSSQGRFMAAMGGFPVVADGKVIGGIGASGGSGEQDVAVAQAALG
jgi:uncharacterized protein GlcG (DUF336 family)